jgi:hypothetical protein
VRRPNTRTRADGPNSIYFSTTAKSHSHSHSLSHSLTHSLACSLVSVLSLSPSLSLFLSLSACVAASPLFLFLLPVPCRDGGLPGCVLTHSLTHSLYSSPCSLDSPSLLDTNKPLISHDMIVLIVCVCVSSRQARKRKEAPYGECAPHSTLHLSLHVISCDVMSCHVISCDVMSCRGFTCIVFIELSHHSLSYHIISHHIISYHIISYHITSYHITSYHIRPSSSSSVLHRHCCLLLVRVRPWNRRYFILDPSTQELSYYASADPAKRYYITSNVYALMFHFF